MKVPFNLAARFKGKHVQTWARGYARYLAMNAVTPPVAGPRHVLFAFCDHFEPLWGNVSADTGLRRVRAWEERYPSVVSRYRDADGRAPRHSFFFPGEQYAPEYLEPLAQLARDGYGEVELHLHHDRDTETTLRASLQTYLKQLAEHGHLSRDADGRLRYAFIHGNWCLANARKDGRYCGVDSEIPLLWDTGCYADFTFPAVPDESQPSIVNQIYWPTGDLSRRRAYEQGERARVGERYSDRILIIEGPSGIARRPGLLARLESGDIQGHDRADRIRVDSWIRQNVHVEGCPEWVFVKVHTHGAPEKNANSLLSDGAHALHSELTGRFNDGRNWQLHYVTAREMYNIAIAAMDGKRGNPNDYRDYLLKPPPVAAN